VTIYRYLIAEYRGFALLILTLLSLFLNSQMLFAQPANPPSGPVKVGVYVSEPFVYKEGDTYNGMAIELWRYVADRIGVTSEFVEFQNYEALLSAVSHSAVDVAVTNLTITEKRAQLVDFTHPWYDVGLRIMVFDQRGTGWGQVLDRLENAGHLATYAWIAGILVAFTLLLTMFDRRFDPGFPKRWRDGFAESFYHIIALMVSGKSEHKNLFGWVGRIWQACWMICGIAVLAYITSSITSVMTIAHLQNRIAEISDLKGRTAGVRTGSVSEQFLSEHGITTASFDHLAEAVTALQNEELAAIVADAPNLEYYLHTHPQQPFSLVGKSFNPDKYGFAFPRNSTWVKAASVAIIRAEENSEIAKIKKKYFGDHD